MDFTLEGRPQAPYKTARWEENLAAQNNGSAECGHQRAISRAWTQDGLSIELVYEGSPMTSFECERKRGGGGKRGRGKAREGGRGSWTGDMCSSAL